MIISSTAVSHRIDDALVRWGLFLQTAGAYRRRQIAGTAPPREARRINDETQPLGTKHEGWNSCSKTVQVAPQSMGVGPHCDKRILEYTRHSGQIEDPAPQKCPQISGMTILALSTYILV